MLKLLGARQIGSRDLDDVRRVLDADPIASCMIASRVEEFGVDPRMIHGELWSRGGPSSSLCFAGANLVPLRGELDDIRAFADRACRIPRMCSSLVGRAELALPLWEMLELDWGSAREVRAEQPLMAVSEPLACAPNPSVRQVRSDELDIYLPAAVSMFIEEVGIDPRANDGGRGYRHRVASLIAAGRAWAHIEDGQVVFKAEVGSVSSRCGQIQGVWVNPEFRGQGHGITGTAAVAESIMASGRIASLYVNSFNTIARSTYSRVGFRQVATFATVLLD
ncbi:GNAT family N-acetyltransferase [Rhodococcus sp. IEGM 1379]|uniref:GNAT family N-acetyltransferase n=1 Tax=Rhodococcus sp. IEGM 1379 TaxID=3047086 RepID=UPI0024B64208|nr:GNAT family N-acetyltransferase [Rhodococcus sp. IEGM 1379]MDI9914590.1 GNAT family N-acetyltransferase [Rhodococcus sp. IEGM 1379]